MKNLLISSVVVYSLSAAVFAQDENFRGAGFNAPTINDHDNVEELVTGEIVFDTKTANKGFWGYNGATWDFLSASANPAGASSSGYVTTSAQDFSGEKTFLSPITAAVSTGHSLIVQRADNAPSIRWNSSSGNGFSIDNNVGTLRILNDAATDTLAQVSQAGEWTFGPSSGGSLWQHTFRAGSGNMSVRLESKSGTAVGGLSLGNSSASGIFDLSVNHSIGSNVGGSTTDQGGSYRIDSRVGQPLMSFYGRAGTTSLGTVTTLATVSATGVWANPFGGDWASTSDSRLKKDVKDLDHALPFVMQLRPVSFQWKDENTSVLRPTIGFIAQEVEKVNPKWVITTGAQEITVNGQKQNIEDVKMIQLDASFNAYLVKAVQELKKENDLLKARLDAIEADKS